MDVLCADKTTALTCNALSVTTVRPMPGFDTQRVLVLVTELHSLGACVVMATGDAPATAAIVAAVKEGRVTFQRIQPYTLNLIVKKIVTAFLLVLGLIMTRHVILNPLLMVILMIAGDFLAMSLTPDNLELSPLPNAWRIGNLTLARGVIGIVLLAFCTGALAIGKLRLGLGTDALQTLTFVVLVFASQATLAAIRQRRGMWGLRPILWLGVSAVADILIASILAVGGIAMTALPLALVVAVLAAAVAFAVMLDALKIPIFVRLKVT